MADLEEEDGNENLFETEPFQMRQKPKNHWTTGQKSTEGDDASKRTKNADKPVYRKIITFKWRLIESTYLAVKGIQRLDSTFGSTKIIDYSFESNYQWKYATCMWTKTSIGVK